MIGSDLSIVNRVSQFYMNTDSYKEQKKEYENILKTLDTEHKLNFIIDDEYNIPLFLFSNRILNIFKNQDKAMIKLWGFLICRENVIRMITASDLSRPAVEALPPNIFDYCIDKNDITSFKQTIGYMIKIIMEMFGYVVEQKKVLLRKNEEETGSKKTPSFLVASRYKKMEKKELKNYLIESTKSNVNSEDYIKFCLKISDIIINNKSQYQKKYRIYEYNNPYKM